MDKDDVYVGLPYLFKMHYDDLKQDVPRLNEYLDKLKKFSEEGGRELNSLNETVSKLRDSVNELFNDISLNQPKLEDSDKK